MNTGKVKFYNETKGYGFIVDDNSQEEYFTHATGLIDKVQENDAVEYELEEGRKGLNAINVKVVK
jgi:cold shock protein